MNGRQIVGLVVLLGAAVGAAALMSGGPKTPGVIPVSPESPTNGASEHDAATGDGTVPSPDGSLARVTPFQRAEECRACHQEVWDEWKSSYHGMAWTDPMVQKLSDGFRMTECIDCHAPQPIHLTGVDQRVAPRLHGRADGVDCLSCHLMEDGVSVASSRAPDTSGMRGACRPVVVKAMGDSTSCTGCHNQHETVNEVVASGTGMTCLDCHMDPVERHRGTTVKAGRKHIFPGAHSLEMHQRAAELKLAVRDGRFVATTTNVGGVHRIPTDARHRSYNVFITLLDEQGNVLQKETQMNDGEYRLYYRNQFKESTQIAYRESREATWPVPEGLSGRAVVRLTYALNPELLAAMDVIEVARMEIPFE